MEPPLKVKEIKRYVPELSGELSTFYEIELGNGRTCLMKIGKIGSPVLSYDLSGIITNQISALERLKEQKKLDELGVSYLGACFYRGHPAVLLDVESSKDFGSLEKLVETNIKNLAEGNKDFSKEQRRKAEDIAGRTDTIEFSRAVDIYAKTLQKVEILHEGGMIHLDIQPENILVDSENNVILIDLGLAREQGGDPLELLNKMVLGVAGAVYYGTINDILCNWFYHPPEFDMKPLPPGYTSTATIDIYNATNVLCLMLTGRLMEYYKKAVRAEARAGSGAARDEEERLKEILRKEIIEKGKRKREQIRPEDLEKIVDTVIKGTRDEYTKRYQTTGEVLEDLQGLNIHWEPSPSTSYPAITSPSDFREKVKIDGYEQPLRQKRDEMNAALQEILNQPFSLPEGNPLQQYYDIIQPTFLGIPLPRFLYRRRTGVRQPIFSIPADSIPPPSDSYLHRRETQEPPIVGLDVGIIQPLSPIDGFSPSQPGVEPEVVPVDTFAARKKFKLRYPTLAAGLLIAASLGYAVYEKYQHRIEVLIPAELREELK